MNKPFQIQRQITEHPKPKPNPESLGFGKYFSDHLLVATYKEGQWQNPEIQPYHKFSLDPAASVLHYGQALFEGMKAFRQTNGGIALFRPEYNWKRMNEGAARLCMPSIPKELFLSGIKELVQVDHSWVPEAADSSLYIRPTLIGTEGFLGVRPSEEYLFFAILSPVGSYYGQGQSKGVKIWIEKEFIRAAPGGLGATKAAANYANSLFAAHRAKQKGYAQVLWLAGDHSHIEEVGTMNVFFVMGNKVVTPPLEGTILAGGVRDSTIKLLQDWKIPVETRPLTLKEIVESSRAGELKEVFGTGTAAVITAVEELHTENEAPIILSQKGFGPISQRLFDHLSGIQRGNLADPHGWITKI